MLKLGEQILELLQRRGPSLPVDISRALNRDSLFAGAMLSDLVGKKQVLITTAKVGGSPLYYLPGQENALQRLFDYLPLKEKEAFKLLQEKRFIRDDETDPAHRVAFRMLKDFAKPFEVAEKGKQVIVWRWYLAPQEEFTGKKSKKQVPQVVQEPIRQVAQQPATLVQETLQNEKKEIQQPLQNKKLIVSKPSQGEIFAPTIEQYFARQQVKVLEREVVRKNNETHYVIVVNTQLGPIEFFVCAKNKKRISDTDLTIAHQGAVEKRMPAVFLTTGELTKKAQEAVTKRFKGALLVRKI